MVSPTDWKTVAIENILIVIFKIQNSRGGGKPWGWGTNRETPVSRGRRRGSSVQEPSLWLLG